MKNIKEKIDNNDGVTILIALVGFMVAAMISVVLVAAAVTAANRVANDKKTNQAHLTLESAAQFVRDSMTDSTEETTYRFTAYKDGKIDTDTGEGTGAFGQEIKTAVEYINTYNTAYDSLNNTSPDTNFEISLKDGDLKTVEVSFTMDKNYNIIFTFRVNGENSSEECLHLDMLSSSVRRDESGGYYVINWNVGSNVIYN